MTDTFARMRQLVGTAAEWVANDLVLGRGELAVELVDPGKFKMKAGDGVLRFSQLPYMVGAFDYVPVNKAGDSDVGPLAIGGPNLYDDPGAYPLSVTGNLVTGDLTPGALAGWEIVAGVADFFAYAYDDQGDGNGAYVDIGFYYGGNSWRGSTQYANGHMRFGGLAAPQAPPATAFDFAGLVAADLPLPNEISRTVPTTAWVAARISDIITGLIYQGAWNAATNAPHLVDGGGTPTPARGWYYQVNVAGSTTLDGNGPWAIGDMAVFNGVAWQRIPRVIDPSQIVIGLGYTPANKAGDTFTGPVTVPLLTVSGAANPGMLLYASGNAANKKRWRQILDGSGNLVSYSENDAGGNTGSVSVSSAGDVTATGYDNVVGASYVYAYSGVSAIIRTTSLSDEQYRPAFLSIWRNGAAGGGITLSDFTVGHLRVEGLGSTGGYAYYGGWNFDVRGPNKPTGGITDAALYLNDGAGGNPAVLAAHGDTRLLEAFATPPQTIGDNYLATAGFVRQLRARGIVGQIIDFAGPVANIPAGYVECNGQALARTGTYAALFAVIGTTWGIGDGTTTFNVPDLNGRATIGRDAAGARVSIFDATAPGKVGGNQNLQAHTHTVTSSISAGSGGGSGIQVVSGSTVTGSTGTGAAQNMPPAAVVLKLIATGVAVQLATREGDPPEPLYRGYPNPEDYETPGPWNPPPPLQ